MKIFLYTLVGIKLALVLLMSTVVLVILNFILETIGLFSEERLVLTLIVGIIFALVGLTINGYLIVRFQDWIFKRTEIEEEAV